MHIHIYIYIYIHRPHHVPIPLLSLASLQVTIGYCFGTNASPRTAISMLSFLSAHISMSSPSSTIQEHIEGTERILLFTMLLEGGVQQQFQCRVPEGPKPSQQKVCSALQSLKAFFNKRCLLYPYVPEHCKAPFVQWFQCVTPKCSDPRANFQEKIELIGHVVVFTVFRG